LYNNKEFCGAPKDTISSNSKCSSCEHGKIVAVHRALMSNILELCTSIISPSNHTKTLFLSVFSQFADKTIIVPHLKHNFERKSSATSDKITIVFLGVESNHKGFNYFEKFSELYS